MIKLLGKIPANKWLDFYSEKYLLTFRPMHIKDINVILMIYFLLCYPIFKMWLELFGQCTSNTNKRFSPCRSRRLPSRFLGSGGTGGGGGCGGASGCGGGSPGADRVLYGGMVSTGGGGGRGRGREKGALTLFGSRGLLHWDEWRRRGCLHFLGLRNVWLGERSLQHLGSFLEVDLWYFLLTKKKQILVIS